MPTPTSPVRRLDALVEELVTLLEGTPDQLVRARWAVMLVERCRAAQETFGDQRTSAFAELRGLGWSLSDLAAEFRLTRARAAQVAVRERYKSGESRGGGGRPRRR